MANGIQISQLPLLSRPLETGDVFATEDSNGITRKVGIDRLQPTIPVFTVPSGQWSGSGSDYYFTVTASNVTAESILIPCFNSASASLFTGTKLWCVPAAGSFTVHVDSKPSGTVTILVQFPGVMGEAQYQVLADVYSKSQTDALIQQSTANIYEKLANNLIVSEQGVVSVPNSTATICYSITLTRGKWLVIGCGDWAANGTGYRQIAFASGLNPDRRRAVTTMGIAEKEAYQQVSQFISTTGETVTLYALQNSGAALNVYPTLYAMRIGDIN